jgi:peptide/nickel transport system substrate-binding protein
MSSLGWKGGRIMVRTKYTLVTVLALFYCTFSVSLATAPFAQEVTKDRKPQGTLRVVDLWNIAGSVMMNYAEGLVTLDKDNNVVPCLAESWRWIDERTIEFRLRRGVSFHSGEPFNAEVVRTNWEAYQKLKTPKYPFLTIPDETVFEIVSEYTVRFTFPEPDGMAFGKFVYFVQLAPAFLGGHKFGERNWGNPSEPGPWGTGPFELVEGSTASRKLSDRAVLKAYKRYWDTRYPKVKTVIFDNTLLKDREEAMRLCRETEGAVDIVSFMRPLDTLKVAASRYAKVVKSRDFTQLHSAINQRKKNSKWRDIRLRKALNHALNREELLKYGAKGNAFNLGGHIPPGARGHNPNLTFYNYDTTKAKSLLAEAGYANGFEMTLITPEAQKLEAQVMKSMYERIGLKVKLEVFPWPVWLRKVLTPSEKYAQEQDWDVSVCYNNDMYGHSGAAHLVYPFLDFSGIRWIEYDPVYERMWRDMARTVDEKAQDKKMQKMEQYVYDRAYAVFIYSPLNLYAVNKEVNFVPQKFLSLRLKETFVTGNHWSVR